jgi:hypothetical protein
MAKVKENNTPAEDPEKIPGFLVYAGQRETADGIAYRFYGFRDENANQEDTDEKDLRRWTFNTPVFKRPAVGAVYKCSFKDDSISFNKNETPCTFWKNTKARVKWQALETAANTAKSLQKAIRENSMIETLQPIREAYRQAGTQIRRNILSEVMRIITS